MNFKAAQVAKFLELQGIKAISVSEANQSEDGEVKITDTVSIQVGSNYIIVVKQNGNSFTFSPSYRTPVSALPTIKKLVI